MMTFSEPYAPALSLDYGNARGREQDWECFPGEEYSVCDPGLEPEFEGFLQNLLPAALFNESKVMPELSHKVQYDPFNAVPYDILLILFDYVQTDDMLSMMTASSCLLNATRHSPSWKHMLHERILPWFWELDSFLSSVILPSTFDYRGLFMWANTVTAEKLGIDRPFMGIANRRRIWHACTEIALLYKEIMAPIHHVESDDDEAKAIFAGAKSLYMASVIYPTSPGVITISTQFIRSWDEIRHRSCDLDTY